MKKSDKESSKRTLAHRSKSKAKPARAPSKKREVKPVLEVPPGCVTQELHNLTGANLHVGDVVVVDGKNPFRKKWSHARFPKKDAPSAPFVVRAAQPIKKNVVGVFYVQMDGAQPAQVHVPEVGAEPAQRHYDDVGGHVRAESFGSRPTKTFGEAQKLMSQRRR